MLIDGVTFAGLVALYFVYDWHARQPKNAPRSRTTAVVIPFTRVRTHGRSLVQSNGEREQDPRGSQATRLTSDARETVAVFLAVRGRVVSVQRVQRQRWRIWTQEGHVTTFRPEFVVPSPR